MIKLVVVNKVKAEYVDTICDVVAELVAKSQQEAGCIGYDFVKDVANENTFLFLETWESQEALDVHGTTEHFTTICPKLGTMMESQVVHKVIC